MNLKTTFSILIFLMAGLFLYSFVLPFKVYAVDDVSEALEKLKGAYTQATQQLSLKTLRLKKQQLGESEISFLQNFIPQNLHTGQFVYNLGQMANQNRLILRGLQYTIVDEGDAKKTNERKLSVEINMDGRYEDFVAWLDKIENSNVLIDVESFRGVKNSNTSEVVSFYIKLYAYGINID